MRSDVKRADGVDGEARDGNGSRWWKRGAIFAVVLGLGVAAWASLGPGHRAKISDAVQTVSDSAQDASTTLKDKYEESRIIARNDLLMQQVAARIHGDKTLGAEHIEVSVLHEGTVILKGLVPDELAKEKAVELTRDTRGVLIVEDHLAIPPSPRYYAAPEATAATQSRRTR